MNASCSSNRSSLDAPPKWGPNPWFLVTILGLTAVVVAGCLVALSF